MFPENSRPPATKTTITQPNDHMSMGSANGRPKKISGALNVKKKHYTECVQKKYQLAQWGNILWAASSQLLLYDTSSLRYNNNQGVYRAYLKSSVCTVMPCLALRVGMASPKSISLTSRGVLRWSTSIMLSSFMSVWITPMLFSASKAVAVCKDKVRDTVQRMKHSLQQSPAPAEFCKIYIYLNSLG